MSKTPKKTRKTAQVLEKLQNLSEKLEYFYYNSSEWKEIKKDISTIEQYLLELSLDRKVDRARLAQKLKNLFFKENKELKEEIKELKEEIKGLKND